MGSVRKLLAITLLALMGLPFASSLFALAPKDNDNLPACCRKNGKHHCMMSMADRSSLASAAPAFAAPLDKCPFTPPALPANTHQLTLAAPQRQMFFAEIASHPAVTAQTESKRRISLDRSRQKRGPPTFSV